MGDSTDNGKVKAGLHSLPELFGAQERVSDSKETRDSRIQIVSAGRIKGFRGHAWRAYLFIVPDFLFSSIAFCASVMILLGFVSAVLLQSTEEYPFVHIVILGYFVVIPIAFILGYLEHEIEANRCIYLSACGRSIKCIESCALGNATLFELAVDDIRGIQVSNKDLHILYGETWLQIEFVEPMTFAASLRRLLLTAHGLTFSDDSLQEVMESLPNAAEEKGPTGRLLLKVGNRTLAVEVEDLDFEPSRRALGFGAAVECTRGRGHGRVARVTLFASGLVEGEKFQLLVNRKLGKETLLNEFSLAKLSAEGWKTEQGSQIWTRGDVPKEEVKSIVLELSASHNGLLVDLSSSRAIAIISLSTQMKELASLTTALGRLLDLVRKEQSELPQGCELIALDGLESSLGQSVICRLCGVAIEEKSHNCPVCDTPHHEDCWHYNGGCTVYACSGRPDKT